MDNSVNQPSADDSISGVFKYVLQHPIETLIYRWHWKSAFFSGLIRTSIFLIGYHNKGFEVAVAAAGIQFIFRIIFGGIGGSIIQTFSKVKPAWHATIAVPLFLTVVSHILEFIIQINFDYYYGTNLATKTTIASITISVMSAVFNLFIMRRGVMLVKDERQQSVWKDFAYIPRLLFDFMMVPSRSIYQKLCQKQYFMAIFIALMQSLGTGIIAAVLRFRVSWGFWTAGIVFGLTVITLIVMAILSVPKQEEVEVNR